MTVTPLPSTSSVTLTDVLDPLSGDRSDVVVDVPAPAGVATSLPGEHLWALPGLYDADIHLPVLERGLRPFDAVRALAGGATTVNTALPWHQVRAHRLADLTSFFARTTAPRVLPVLSVADTDSDGFVAWMADHGEELRETWMPTVKLYSNDPHFDANLEAIWAAGCRAAVYFYDDAAFERVVTTPGGPVHFRHVTSKAMAEAVAARADSTCQTSPHFLVELPPGRSEELHVLPPVPGGAARESILATVTGAVDMIASDHNAPIVGKDGPGLDGDQHLLQALLRLVADEQVPLADVVRLTTTGPVGVFRPAAAVSDARIVVDPTVQTDVTPWPGQEARRAAYSGLRLPGAVIAVAGADQSFFV